MGEPEPLLCPEIFGVAVTVHANELPGMEDCKTMLVVSPEQIVVFDGVTIGKGITSIFLTVAAFAEHELEFV